MQIKFFPKTNLGKYSLGLLIIFFICLGIFFLFCRLGEKGGDTFFSNLKLTIPYCLAAIAGITSFFTGIISVIKNKERAIIVFLSIIIGSFVLFWVLAEILFPH